MCTGGASISQFSSQTRKKVKKVTKNGDYPVYYWQNCCTSKILWLFLQNLKSNFYSYYFFLGHLVEKRSAFFIRTNYKLRITLFLLRASRNTDWKASRQAAKALRCLWIARMGSQEIKKDFLGFLANAVSDPLFHEPFARRSQLN